MEREKVLSVLDRLTIEDSVSYIMDGTITEDDVLLAKIPSSVKDDIISTYKRVLAIKQRIFDKETEKEKIQSIESSIVSDEREYEKPCRLISKDLKYGYQTTEGKNLIPIEFEEIIPLKRGFFIIKYKSKYGCWRFGKKIVDYKYDHIVFHNQLDCFQLGIIRGEVESWGMINGKGEMLLPISSCNIIVNENRRMLIVHSSLHTCKFARMSTNGTIEDLYVSDNSCEYNGTRYYIVRNKLGKYGIVSINFNCVVPVEYESIQQVSSVGSMAFIAKRSGQYGVIDLCASEIIPFVYNNIRIENGEYIISKGRVSGIANRSGEIILSISYSQIGRLINGLRTVSIGSKWGYVDVAGNLIVPFIYDAVRDFSGNYAIAKKGNLWGVIDKNNVVIIPFIYVDIVAYNDLEAFVVNNGRLEGVIDLKTKNRTPCQYAEIHPKYREEVTGILRCDAYDISFRNVKFMDTPSRHSYVVDVVSLEKPEAIEEESLKVLVSYVPASEMKKTTNSLEDKKRKVGFLRSIFMGIARRRQKNDVYSSIFAPAEVKRKSHLQVQVYLHLYEESEKVKSLAKESDKNAERRDYIPLSLKLKKGDKVDVEFNVYGETRLMSERKSIIWQGAFTKCSFDYFVPKDINVDELSCVALLSVNGVPVGEMQFITQVVELPRQLNPEIIAHKYSKVFVSYSHQDESKVKFLHEGLELGSVPHFFDRKYLKAGDVFPQVIQDYINSADLFILCWSENASKSEYVQKERLQALGRAFPQVKPENAAKLRIYPMSIEPRAELPSDMKEIYNFEVI